MSLCDVRLYHVGLYITRNVSTHDAAVKQTLEIKQLLDCIVVVTRMLEMGKDRGGALRSTNTPSVPSIHGTSAGTLIDDYFQEKNLP